MISELKLLQLYGSLARHSAADQAVRAENIANADVPGYKAQEIEAFADFLDRSRMAVGGDRLHRHLQPAIGDGQMPAKPNGNTVNLENEALRAAEAAGRHDMALTVYNKSLDLLRSALGRRQ